MRVKPVARVRARSSMPRPLVCVVLVVTLLGLGTYLHRPEPLARADVGASTYAQMIVGTPGLQGYWRLGEKSGPVAGDESLNANNGLYVGDIDGFTLGQTGALGGDPDTAVRLDGSSGRVNIPPVNSLDLGDGPFTLEAWVKRSVPPTSDPSDFNPIISKGSGAYWLTLTPASFLGLRVPGTTGPTPSQAYVALSRMQLRETGRWHHVVATKDGPVTHLYIDGADVTGIGTDRTLIDNPEPLRIGFSPTSFYLEGSVDEVAVYNQTLSRATIREHYLVGRNSPQSGSELRRYPYLTDVVGSSATVNWATGLEAQPGSVKWGEVQSDGSCSPANPVEAQKTPILVDAVKEYQWKAELALSPDTRYCYRVYAGSGPEIDLLGQDPSPRFQTQLPAGSTKQFSFAVFGDWGATEPDGTNPNQASLLSQLATSGARFALSTGDHAYPDGSQANYGDLRQAGEHLSGVFGPQFWRAAGASLPLFPALGNHDLDEDLGESDPSSFIVNWPQSNAVSTSGGTYTTELQSINGTVPRRYASAWYAFNAGNARFYVLDASWSGFNPRNADSSQIYQNEFDLHWKSSPGGESPEYQWLRNDLVANESKPLKFAIFHFPLYTDSPTEPADTLLRGDASLEGLLASHGVNIAFNGHSHIYERNQPSPLGLRTYVTGGGGAGLGVTGSCGELDAYAIGWSLANNRGTACGSAPTPTSPSQVNHFLLVNVDDKTVRVSPTNALGCTFDVVTYDFATGSAKSEPGGCPASPVPSPLPGSVLGAPPGPPAINPGPVRPRVHSVVSIAGRRIKVNKRGIASVGLSCRGVQACVGRLLLSAASSSRSRSKRRVLRLSSRRFSIPPGRTVKVKARLSKPGFRILKKLKKLKVQATVTLGETGSARPYRRVLTLQAP